MPGSMEFSGSVSSVEADLDSGRPMKTERSNPDSTVGRRATSTHVYALDGVRGLAVLGVMASHLFPGTYMAGGLFVRVVGRTFEFGARGVDLFFVLSGFLITGILYDSLDDGGFFRKFYARRCLRIFPLYYGVLLVLFVLTPLLGIEWHRMQWSLIFYLQNTSIVTPIWDFWMPHGLNLGHFWSLAVEEQFYLIWPLAVFFIRDRKKLLIACAALSLGALLLRFYFAFHDTPYQFINCGTWFRADSLLAGAALALLIRGSMREAMSRYGHVVFWGAAFVLGLLNILGIFIERQARWTSDFDASYLAMQYTVMALGCAGLIAWCLRTSSVASSIFENRLLRWFGRYSYGLYVLHLVAFGFLLHTFRGWLEHFTSDKLAIVVISGLLVFAVSVVAAYASYHLYEKPLLRLKRFVEYDRPETIPVIPEQENGQLAGGSV